MQLYPPLGIMGAGLLGRVCLQIVAMAAVSVGFLCMVVSGVGGANVMYCVLLSLAFRGSPLFMSLVDRMAFDQQDECLCQSEGLAQDCFHRNALYICMQKLPQASCQSRS